MVSLRKFGLASGSFSTLMFLSSIIPVTFGYRHHGIEYWQTTVCACWFNNKQPFWALKPQDPATTNSIRQCNGGEDFTCSTSIPSGGINAQHLTVRYLFNLRLLFFCAEMWPHSTTTLPWARLSVREEFDSRDVLKCFLYVSNCYLRRNENFLSYCTNLGWTESNSNLRREVHS